jgi:hypothetical protein
MAMKGYDPKNQLPPAGSCHCACDLLPESEFRPGGGPKFQNGLPGPAQNAFQNGARPAGRIGPGGSSRGGK